MFNMKINFLVALMMFVSACNAETNERSPKMLAHSCDPTGEYVSAWLVGLRERVSYIAVWMTTSSKTSKLCIVESNKNIGRVVEKKTIAMNNRQTFTSGTCTQSGQPNPFLFSITSSADSGEDVKVFQAWIFNVEKQKLIGVNISDVKCVAS